MGLLRGRYYLATLALVLLALAVQLDRPSGKVASLHSHTAGLRVTSHQRPNVLIILTDDQRGGMPAMPVTRRLFRVEGVTYRDAYVTDPLCCPSRASIMTGRYPHNTGVKSNSEIHPAAPGWRALDQQTTIQHYLHSAGYTTGIVGKFLNGWPKKRTPSSFDRWWITHNGQGDRGGYAGSIVTVGSGAGSASKVRSESLYNTTFIRRRALKFLTQEAPKKGPWYLYLAPHAPHAPFTAQHRFASDTFGKWPGDPAVGEKDLSDKPPAVRHKQQGGIAEGRAIRTAQYRTLESVDRMVRAVFAKLRALGQSRNTLAFFISDNGYMWGEHGLTHTKDFPYQPSVRVPILARWPGHLPARRKDHRLASNIDIAPTILQATGTSPPSTAPSRDGRSLLVPFRRRRELTEHWCNIDHCMYWASDTTQRHQYTEYYAGPRFAKATVTFREFYNLKRDPWELRNLLHDGNPDNNPDIGSLHKQLMHDYLCDGESCP